jgi:hypothetical protein
VIASCFVSYLTSYDTRTEAVRDFRELRTREVRRMPLPRTRVNKGREKGRGMEALTLLALFPIVF